MICIRHLSTIVTVLSVVCLSCVNGDSTEDGRYSGRVLLVSMDGFRWDYLKTIPGLGNFSRLASTGCSVDYVKNVFATKTFPSHYSIATGLYEENHGIVSNHMYDPARNATFNKGSNDSFWWDGGEPVWVTAERQNKRTGVYFWPGCEVEIRGYRPSEYPTYNQSVPFVSRVKTVLGWLKEGGMDLVLLYFHEPDQTGHMFGPESPQVADKVREMDGILGLILSSMESMGLDDVNIIITSDHGMTEISAQDRLLNLWDYLNPDTIEKVPDSGTVTAILPVGGKEEEVLNASRRIPHVTVYRKEDIPEHFHYKYNARIMPIIILSDEGWILTTNVSKQLKRNGRGNHGYSNDLPSMWPIFHARGPDFRKGVHSNHIGSLDIYPLVCRLLNIEPAPNNGSLAMTAQFLTNRAARPVAWSLFHWHSDHAHDFVRILKTTTTTGEQENSTLQVLASTSLAIPAE